MLPDEIIAEIFLHCLPREYGRGASLNPKEAPVLLTHVCQRWRIIAVNEGRLWAALRFRPTPEFVAGNPRLLLILAISALQRCKGCKHSVELHFADGFNSLPSDTLSIPLQPFLLLDTSLATLALRNVRLKEMVNLRRGLFPALESLALSFRGQGVRVNNPKTEAWVISAFEDAPNLHRVAFNTETLDESIDVQLSLPWNQITHLLYISNQPTLHSIYKDRLPAATQLRYLSIHPGYDDYADSEAKVLGNIPSVTQYERLEWLSLDCWAADIAVIYPLFLEYAAFPSLKKLRISGPPWDFVEYRSFWPTGLKDRFIAKLRDLTHLEYFSLDVGDTSPATLVDVFSSIPKVKTLDLYIFENYQFVFEALTHSEDPANSLLPHLSTLTIEASRCQAHEDLSDPESEDQDYDPQPIDAGVFQTFLESRTRCPEEFRLRKVVVYGTRTKDLDETAVDFIRCLNGFRSRGLEVDLRHVVAVARSGVRAFSHNLWLDRDPIFEQWPEARIID